MAWDKDELSLKTIPFKPSEKFHIMNFDKLYCKFSF